MDILETVASYIDSILAAVSQLELISHFKATPEKQAITIREPLFESISRHLMIFYEDRNPSKPKFI